MGVPKFYRWISERYPCLSEVLKEYQLPEFDNLYLDMNGIIHVCSHPEDNNPHFRITEEKIFSDIFHYIEVLFRMIKPRKVFFMAIDGVAPRAKMNQQRGRRFRSAREAEELIKRAISKGEVLPTEQRFDSNCITPGTEFMDRLNEQLKYFVAKKVSTDRLWQGLRIFLSGHETPGEGEHKVMDFIRYEKSQPEYDPNTRHCLYGLDADLIMLGLAAHEPHFSLLREEVRFTGKNSQKRSIAPEETTFHLLHLSLMREYLDYEFGIQLKTALPFEYDLERIIDDWVLMGFLVGNDFIPHLPHLHIHADCLPLLWQTYKTVLPTLDGYLNENGYLNLPRFEKYLSVLAQFDFDNFQEKYADLKWAESKRKQRLATEDGTDADVPKPPIHYKTSSLSSEMVGIPSADEYIKRKGEFEVGQGSLEELVDGDGLDGFLEEGTGAEEESSSSSSEEDSDAEFQSEFRKYKANYYTDKMDFTHVTQDVLKSQAHGYIKALQWILHYYYNGVQSWSWYYPHHYAPYLSDVKGFSDLKIEFERGQPFMPFEQLMAVLPTASKKLLPEALQGLMVNDLSPVKDYYPIDFETDLNGKMQEWEAVVLIPFIDEERLTNAMKPLMEKLSPAEKARNKHGPHLLFEYVPEELEPLRSSMPAAFPDIMHNHAKMTEVSKDTFVIPIHSQVKGLCKGVRLDVIFPGFPTLKNIPHRAVLKKAGVKVFQMNSRNENFILELDEKPYPDGVVEQIARDIVGRSVFVGWPHVYEALVESVATDEVRYCCVEKPSKDREPSAKVEIRSEPLTIDQQAIWHKEALSVQEWYYNRMGVDIKETTVIVYARPMTGRRYVCGQNGVINLEKQWQTRPLTFAHQIIVKDIEFYEPSFKQYKTLQDLYPAKTLVFLLGRPNYGASGEVMDIQNDRVRGGFKILEEPDLTNIKRDYMNSSSLYSNAYSLAQQLKITPHHLSRITGTVYIVKGSAGNQNGSRLNVGLNLKFNKTNKEVPGYTRKTGGDWTYSDKVLTVLKDYLEKFPEVFDCLRVSSNNDLYYEDDVFKANNKHERMKELEKYLEAVPCAQVSPAQFGTLCLDEQFVQAIETEVSQVTVRNKKKIKLATMQVRPHLLYQPLLAQSTATPDPITNYELFDRVVNVRDGYSVPLGLRGTVISIMAAEKEQDILYEVLFDETFDGGLTVRSSPNRVYRMPASAMINITFGEERRENVVKRQQFQTQQQQQWQASPRSQGYNNNAVRQTARQQQQSVGGSAGSSAPARLAARNSDSPNKPDWRQQNTRPPGQRQSQTVSDGSTRTAEPPGKSKSSGQQPPTQPVPVIRLLTRPKPDEKTSSVAAVPAASSQPEAVTQQPQQDNGFALIWSQLQKGLTVVNGTHQNTAATSAASSSETLKPSSVASIEASTASAKEKEPPTVPGIAVAPVPSINGQPLRPPQAWLMRPTKDEETPCPDLLGDVIKSDKVCFAEELESQAQIVPSVKQLDTEKTHTSASAARDPTHDGEDLLTKLFKSVEVVERKSSDRAPDSTVDGSDLLKRQLTVEELFKGVDECRQWKPLADLPDHALTESALRAMSLSEDETRNRKLSDDRRHNGSLQAPGSAVMIPLRPTLVELGGRSRPVDSMDDTGKAEQLAKSKQSKQKQLPDQQQQQPESQQQKVKPKDQHKQKQLQQQQRFQMPPQQQHMFPNAAGVGGMMNRMAGAGPVMMGHQPRSSVEELHAFCAVRGMAGNGPRFDCKSMHDGRFQATVFINNMAAYVGSIARTYEQAIESAAACGLHNLKTMAVMHPGMFYQRGSVPAPGFSSSANSAFRPVHAGYDFPAPFGFGMNQPPFGMRGPMAGNVWGGQPYRQQQQMTPLARSGAPFSSHRNAHKDNTANSHSAVTTAANQNTVQILTSVSQSTTSSAPSVTASTQSISTPQFVPTQVMRQQKTPHKSDKSSSQGGSSHADQPQEVLVNPPANTVTTPNAKTTQLAVPELPPASSVTTVSDANPHGVSSHVSTTPINVETKTPNSRKSRSRVAANFNALGSSPSS